jgi:hypothetical protein
MVECVISFHRISMLFIEEKEKAYSSSNEEKEE